ncbi:hypothetical protein SKAU_G00092450 [Synaphobranchus kaupii]|uniref:Uncharacterized protein n=1 Tax=Synaphobranchus kaupii TaxID=118154 RepID=A0A9Q1FXG3_SYNKA|nr:hypothetical protein SKAU_G00092450 [Synaphobranchus kaupii]
MGRPLHWAGSGSSPTLTTLTHLVTCLLKESPFGIEKHETHLGFLLLRLTLYNESEREEMRVSATLLPAFNPAALGPITPLSSPHTDGSVSQWLF